MGLDRETAPAGATKMILLNTILDVTTANFLQNLGYCIDIAEVLFWPVAAYMSISGIDLLIEYITSQREQPG